MKILKWNFKDYPRISRLVNKTVKIVSICSGDLHDPCWNIFQLA